MTCRSGIAPSAWMRRSMRIWLIFACSLRSTHGFTGARKSCLLWHSMTRLRSILPRRCCCMLPRARRWTSCWGGAAHLLRCSTDGWIALLHRIRAAVHLRAIAVRAIVRWAGCIVFHLTTAQGKGKIAYRRQGRPHGDVAQLGERSVRNAEAEVRSPSSPP